MREAIESLSPRENAVLHLLAQGKTDRAIAAELNPPVSEHTVAEYLRRIYRKLGVNSRAEAATIFASGHEPHDDGIAGD